MSLSKYFNKERKIPEVQPFTIGIFGKFGVGKSSLINRFIDNKFTLSHSNTAYKDTRTKLGEVTFKNKENNLVNRSICYYFEDHEGYNENENVDFSVKYDAYVICYSRDDVNSLKNAETILGTIYNINHWKKNNKRNSTYILSNGELPEISVNPSCVLVQTKSDLNLIHEFAPEFICKNYNIDHVVVSAKNNVGVNELFANLAISFYQKVENTERYANFNVDYKPPLTRSNSIASILKIFKKKI